MARQKTPKVVITFSTTSDAMAMEAAARAHDIPGRIIPVPTQIDAGCGLAWSADIIQRDAVVRGLEGLDLAYEGIFEVLMY